MLTLFVVLIGYAACRYGPPILVAIVATLVGIVILSANRRAHRALVAIGCEWRGCPSAWDRRPIRRERRLQRASLRAAIRSTEFTSLLPEVASRVRRITG